MTGLAACLPDRAARMVAADYTLPADYRDALYGGYTGQLRPGVAWSRAYTFLDTVRGLPFLNNTASVIGLRMILTKALYSPLKTHGLVPWDINGVAC